MHVADGEHAAGPADGEVDPGSRAVEVVVEIAAVAAGEPVRQRLAVRGDPDHADHRPGGEADALVHLDPPVLDAEHARDRRLDLLDQLSEAGDQAGEAHLDRPDVQDLRDQRITRFRAPHGDGAGCAVDAIEVDRRDEVVLRRDLSGEAVVRLERDGLAGIDLEHRLELGPECPDDLIATDPVADRGRHHAGPTAGDVSGATVSSSTYTRSMSRSFSGARRWRTTVSASPTPIQPRATQFAYLIGYVGGNFTYS